MRRFSPMVVLPWLLLAILICLSSCEENADAPEVPGSADYSGNYCVEAQSAQLVIDQRGTEMTFTLSSLIEVSGTGTVDGRTVTLRGALSAADSLTASLVFADQGQSFSGTLRVLDASGAVTMEGPFDGVNGACATYDIETNGMPRFVTSDFTRLELIDSISRFRSGFGHSYTDRFESCRSMKHYYTPDEAYRRNDTVPVYSPVAGSIIAVQNDGHGASVGLDNKLVLIKPDSHPAFAFRIFHTDLVSADIVAGKPVEAGALIGHARLYYDDLGEVATSFDIAVSVNTPAGVRLVSYFETMADTLFSSYVARGADSRQDFIIAREARDGDPLACDGETFTSSGTIENWVVLDR